MNSTGYWYHIHPSQNSGIIVEYGTESVRNRNHRLLQWNNVSYILSVLIQVFLMSQALFNSYIQLFWVYMKPQTSTCSCVNCLDCITQKSINRNTRQEVHNYSTEEGSCSQRWDGWAQSHECWGSDPGTHQTTWSCYTGIWPRFCVMYILASVYTFLHVHLHRNASRYRNTHCK